jgi:putative Ca2+/H+ antiporter (TMEM165/GDT1 family)
LISLGLGYGLKELLPQGVVPWIAAALFLGFGLKLLFDAQGMAADAADGEAQDAQTAIDRAEQGHSYPTAWSVIWEAFGLVFIAELGDRTQFATIFLAAGPGFTFAGLLAGSLLGHGVVTALAVGAGQWIGKRVDEALLYRLS